MKLCGHENFCCEVKLQGLSYMVNIVVRVIRSDYMAHTKKNTGCTQYKKNSYKMSFLSFLPIYREKKSCPKMQSIFLSFFL